MADKPRLELLARIVLRLSEVPAAAGSAVPNLLSELDQRLNQLAGSGESRALDRAVEDLFRAGLNLKTGLVQIRPTLRAAVRNIGSRAAKLDTPLGSWIRRERARELWASQTSESA